MNLQEKRDAIHERIASMTEERLDELMPILSNPNHHLSVSEDDSALAAYRKPHSHVEYPDEQSEPFTEEDFHRNARKRNAASEFVDGMERSQVEFVYNLLEETGDGFVLSAEEWAEIERDAELAEKGLIEVRPSEEVIEELRIKLENLRK
jgi:hypothetical protein